ncbi:glutaredoxin-like protein [Opisthorchis viverrini]|uniref:Glutaredoxin-like protein n=1 Tax=Opisthorchis viverrini TaxID=6198 RepID=A0A1S8XA51_OPIVI|nr:glutaredoxin-like protein [Opisthorchis viverrini]
MLSSRLSSLVTRPPRIFQRAPPLVTINRLTSQTLAYPSVPTLVMFTKPDCSLCRAAIEQLRPYANKYFRLQLVDITEAKNSVWRKYQYDIPVFHILSVGTQLTHENKGTYLMKHHVDWNRLKNSIPELDQCPELDEY